MDSSSAPLTASTNTTNPTNETTYFANSPPMPGWDLSSSDFIDSSCAGLQSSTSDGRGRKRADSDGRSYRPEICSRITGYELVGLPRSGTMQPIAGD